ncbi:MAG TPA: bifunctional phosphopantothenoylcysteine decarboxylase/phosphopantothenate--cysteine ligase CoaBC [Candidatus Tectomicrobia bacterium]|nr:bifunctional phosphopantothenoylcysteine decarboxylase/phosphopantothenate--cysteine ligase CoaBC [Candidatus Tectomicrobia bacterium]
MSEAQALEGKTIVLGVTGSIAAFKAVEVLRRLTKAGANVVTMMTRAACQFVGPLTFQTLARHPVMLDEEAFRSTDPRMKHIWMAETGDLVLVAPATADIIGKYANGIADDLLSTFLLTTVAPVMLAPAMETNMYTNPIVQHNMARLKAWGIEVIEAEHGVLASGKVGQGRMVEPEQIVARVTERLSAPRKPQDLIDRTVLVTAGPTQEPIDTVRFISNPSSGKMGYAIAEAAHQRGAKVILVSGPTNLTPLRGVTSHHIRTACEMREAVVREYETADVVIKAAAVSDYRPKQFIPYKVKKNEEMQTVELVRNPDILAELGQRKGKRVLVGFAAETDDLLTNAQKKVQSKHLDMIVANDVRHAGIGFQSDENKVLILHDNGRVEDLPLMSKQQLAHEILARVVARLRAMQGPSSRKEGADEPIARPR